MTAMPSAATFQMRKECPPGACDCGRDDLLRDPQADLRILRLTRDEEKRLVERILAISSYADLAKVGARMRDNLGIALHIVPSPNEVRSARGLRIHLDAHPGLCRKTRQAIPAAVRKCLDTHREILFAILDQHDLLGAAAPDGDQAP